MLSVSSLQISPGNSNHYSDSFRNLIENHLHALRNDKSTLLTSLTVHDEDVFIGDFYGLLQKININQDMFWIIMRINNLHSPLDYTGTFGSILIPSANTITILLTRHINAVINS